MTKKIDKKIQEQLDRMVDQAGEEEFPQGFDARFWNRFEREKDSAIPFSVTSNPIPMVPVMAGGMGIVLILAFFGFFIFQTPDEPFVNLIQGNVSRAQKGSDLVTLSKGTQLKTGDQIVTGLSDWAILELPDHYQVKIESNSSLTINQLKKKWFGKSVFHLSKGQVLVSIGSQKPYPFEVKTPNAYARAIGTQFAVQVSSFVKPVSWVGILEGKVEVGKLGSDLSIPVTAGNEIYISEEITKPTEREMMDERRQELKDLFQFAKKNQLILLISMSENRVNELLEPALLYFIVENDREDLKQIPIVMSQLGKALKSGDILQQEKAIGNLEQAIRNQKELDQVSGLLYAGAYYYFLQKYNDSVRVFEDVIKQYPKSSLRSLALMAAAKIYDENLNNPERALELTDTILKEYPKSYEAKPAEMLRDEIQKN